MLLFIFWKAQVIDPAQKDLGALEILQNVQVHVPNSKFLLQKNLYGMATLVTKVEKQPFADKTAVIRTAHH